MPVFLLGSSLEFPPVELAEDGLLAIGGDLRPERLVRAYASGIFPWYADDEPIMWHSPDPRMVLESGRLHVSRRLRRTIERAPFRVTLDRAFERVIRSCAGIERRDERGTWITPDMIAAYEALHEQGLAHSVEAWDGEELAGGLYGVSLGAAFFGESMFARRPDASKVAFVRVVEQLDAWGITLVDCQIPSDHLARFGARVWSRSRYLSRLALALETPTRQGRWTFD